jgi:hypothetical protein
MKTAIITEFVNFKVLETTSSELLLVRQMVLSTTS